MAVANFSIACRRHIRSSAHINHRYSVKIKGCWFSHPPEGDICENDSCGVGKMAWIFGGFPMLLGVMTISTSNLVLFCYVRSTVKRAQERSSKIESTVQVEDEEEDAIIRTSSLSQRLSGKFSGRSSGRSSGRATSSRKEWQRVKELGNQSFLYVGSYFLCFIWTMTKGALDGEGFDKLEGSGSIFLPLLILQSIFLPIHGFFRCVWKKSTVSAKPDLSPISKSSHTFVFQHADILQTQIP